MWWEKYEGLVPGAGLLFPEENWLPMQSIRGSNLVTYRYPCQNPRGLLFIIHGMSLHANWYGHIVRRFASESILVLSMDQEFHGKSEGEKGEIIRMEDFAVDTKVYIEKCKEIYPDLPVFVLGESMGGFVATYMSTIMTGISGLLLLAPALGVEENYEKCLRRMLKVLACLCPRLRLKGADYHLMTRNTYFTDYVNDDPLVFKGKSNARTGLNILRGLENVPSWINKTDTPFLIVQGGDEAIVSKDLSKEFYENGAAEDKRMIYVEDMKHLISLEPNFPEILEEMVDWVNQRI